MATFTGQLISATYDAILKTIDNDAIGGTAKQLTDGLGNVTPLYVSTTQLGIGITPTEVLHVSGNIKASATVLATTFSGDLSGTINTATTGTTQGVGDDSTKIATTAFVQASHAGKPTGSGTGGKIALWSGSGVSTTLTDSAVTQESTQLVFSRDIRIADTYPSFTLEDNDSAGSAAKGDIVWLDNAAAQKAIISLNNSDLGITSKGGALTFGTNSTPAASIDASQNTILQGNLTTGGNGTTNSGAVTINGGITQNFSGSAATTNFLSIQNTATASASSDASQFKIIQKDTSAADIVYSQGLIATGNAYFGTLEGTGSVKGMNLNIGTGNATFSGNLTVDGTTIHTGSTTFNSSISIISGNTSTADLYFGDTDEDEKLKIDFNNSDNSLNINLKNETSGANEPALKMTSSREFVFTKKIEVNQSGSTFESNASDMQLYLRTIAPATGRPNIILQSNHATEAGIISVSGGTTMTFDKSKNTTFGGNVGIGAAPVGNPGTQFLAVGEAGVTSGGIQLWATSSQAHYLQFGDANSGGEFYRGGIGYNHSSETLLFLQNSSTALSFTGSQAATFAGDVAINGLTNSDYDADADNLVLGSTSGNTGITIRSGSSAGNYGSIYFADGTTATANKAGYIRYEQNTSEMTIGINAVQKLSIALDGTATFAGSLHVISADNQLARFESTDAYGGIEICDDTSGTAKPLISALGNAFIFYNGGSSHTEAMRIDSSQNATFTGNVAITKASSAAELTLTGGNDSWTFDTYYTDNKLFIKSNGAGGTVMTLLGASGNVGIGTDSPDELMEIKGASGLDGATPPTIKIQSSSAGTWTDNATFAKLAFGNDDTSGGIACSINAYVDSTTGNNAGLSFYTSGSANTPTERMRIDNIGNVKIATPITNAFYGLSLQYNAADTADFKVNQATGQIKIGGVATGYFPTFYSGGSERMRITSGGELQLGSGAYTSIEFDVDPASHSGNGGLDIKPITVPGSGSSQWYTRFKSNVATGSTIHNVIVDGSAEFGNPSGTSNGRHITIDSLNYNTVIQGTSSANILFIKNGTGLNANVGMIIFQSNAGNASGQITTNSATNTTAYNTSGSDERLKKNITDWDENVLDKFKDIQPKEFHFKTQEDSDGKIKGYIAQNEVDKFPEAYPLVKDDESGEKRYQFNPSGMNVYLMKAIQELTAKVERLEQECKCK